ncbi:ABC transporter permease [Candidatus Cryosericum hinesii]|jgi:ribose transport system permease protein|uniref:ABC transporter permease n=1 Tax=Candidatus Cryosericum hinesii TaxID=2290915 RepID=A0A398DA32_9BACT|nr:ABC transporter permease [Candidatus Cryosericum hinesii]RIE11460.1 ABC transporter permease [Candidatus Cryosericum hinesii]RIE15432.1 ABC transporter permease [Candidatus Cryosericum hinesii]
MGKKQARGWSVVSAIVKQRESAIFLALLIMIAVIQIMAPNLLSGNNVYLVSRQIALVAIVAIGELFVILTGGIDLSVGATMGLAGVASAGAMVAGVNPWLAILFGMVVGVLIGIFNGWLVSYVLIPPFIVTLGSQEIARGTILIVTKGWPITNIPKSILFIAQGDFLHIPVPVWIMLVVAVIAQMVLTKTSFGRRIYAIGGNETATFLSGVNVKKIKFFLYVIAAFTASIVGIILVARFESAQADAGTGWEMQAIASAVIGGTSLAGGAGSVLGCVIGACIMGILANGLVLMRVSSYWQTAIIGVVIVLAAVLDHFRKK